MRSMKYLILLFWFFERKMLELSNFYSAAFFWDVCIIILLSQNFVRLVFVHAFFVSRSSFCFSFKKKCMYRWLHACIRYGGCVFRHRPCSASNINITSSCTLHSRSTCVPAWWNPRRPVSSKGSGCIPLLHASGRVTRRVVNPGLH